MTRAPELVASEQMRDRIASQLNAEAMRRSSNGGGGRVRRAFLGMERQVRALPGMIAQRLGPTSSDSAWAAALAEYQRLREHSDVLPADHPDEDAAIDRYCEAMDHLVQDVRAPDADAIVTKIELARTRWDGFTIPDEWLDAIIADVRHIGGAAA